MLVCTEEDGGSDTNGMGLGPGRHLRIGLLTSLALDPGGCGMTLHLGTMVCTA